MAVKRNINISSTISRLDRRVNGVESRAVALSGGSGIVTTTADDRDPNSAPGALGEDPPYTYRPVIKAYIYGGKVTGNSSRLELYFSEDPEIAPQDTMRLQGLHGTSTDNFELSPKTFKVLATDTEPWDDLDNRGEGVDGQLRRSWRDTPTTGNNGETVTHTVFFNPVVEVPSSYSSTAGRELITTRRIDTMSVTGSTVTVTLNSTHLFEVGDVIYIDSISTHTVLFGVDGLFKVSEVVSGTVLKYELDSPVPTPFSLTSTQVGTKYVYPVAQRFVEEGTVWTDTSVTPNKVFVWKDYRWYDTADPIGDVAATQDGIAPSPVTGLDVTSSLPSGSTSPVLSLTWTPPTTRSNGSSISGFLDGYDIWYKRSTESLWKKEFVKDGGQGISSHEIKDAILLQNFTYNIRVYTVDIMGQYSTAATDNVLTASYSETLNPPSTPTATSKLGTITVTWDGLDSAAALPVPGVLYIEFHESTTSGFTPSSSTLVESVPITNGGNYIVRTGRLFDGTTFYYYKTRFVRQISPTELVTSAASTQSTGLKVVGVTGPDVVANSITTNNIEAGFITAALVRGDIISAGTVGANSRVELKTSGIFAFNSANDPVFSFDTSSSTLTIGGYATSSDLSSGLNGKIATGGAASDVNSGATTISGGKITTGTIDASRITVTDTFTYKSSDVATPAYQVKIGPSAITSYSGTSAGLGFYQSGTQFGYLATWGAGVFELGANFSSAYLTIGLNADNNLIANFDNGYDFSGTVFRSYAALSIQRTSTAAVFVGASSSSSARMLNIDTSAFNITVGNGTFAATNQSLDVWGRIRATGTITASTSLSSSRFKTDIREYLAPAELLNITPKIYKYDNSVVYETWADKTKNKMPAYSEDNIGAIAEDFIDIGLGYLVSRDEDGRPEALDYSKISVLLIPYIKDLYNQIEELKKER